MDVRIELPFDKFLFTGGLQQAGKWVKKNRGHDMYVHHTEVLFPDTSAWAPMASASPEQANELLLRHAILETVQYYLHRQQDIEDTMDSACSIHGGYILVFRFVRGDGVCRNWDDIVKTVKEHRRTH